VSGFSWVVPTPPNLQGFGLAVRSDTSGVITPAVRIGLAQLVAQVANDVNYPTLCQQDWSDAVATYSGTWLTSDVQTKLLFYANEFNIPFVSTSPSP
jgi:hypothetical protein